MTDQDKKYEYFAEISYYLHNNCVNRIHGRYCGRPCLGQHCDTCQYIRLTKSLLRWPRNQRRQRNRYWRKIVRIYGR